MPTTILITGATGFVGHALVMRLAQSDHPIDVVACQRKPPSRPWPANVKAVSIDHLGMDTDWTTALSGVAVVVHCAARVHTHSQDTVDCQAQFRQVNVDGTLQLARQAAQCGVKRFIFLSTVKVHGETSLPGLPFRPEDPPGATDPYGMSKHEAEQGLQAISHDTGLELTVVRPTLVYGPGVKANFATMMQAIADGIPLPLAAVNDNRRSLLALDNLVDLLITCIDHPGAANQVFLASDGHDLSTAELLQRLALAMGKQARLFSVPPVVLRWGANALGKGRMAQRLLESLQVDIAKNRTLLGWTPPVNVDEGLRRTVRAMNYEKTV